MTSDVDLRRRACFPLFRVTYRGRGGGTLPPNVGAVAAGHEHATGEKRERAYYGFDGTWGVAVWAARTRVDISNAYGMRHSGRVSGPKCNGIVVSGGFLDTRPS